MYDTGSTQPTYGVWNIQSNSWIRDATGCVAVMGEQFANQMVLADPSRLVKKRVYICSDEQMVDNRLPELQRKWNERIFNP